MVALYNPLQTLQYPHGAPCLTLQLRRVSDGSFRSCQLCQDFLAPQQQQQQPENAHLGYSAASSLLIKSVFFQKIPVLPISSHHSHGCHGSFFGTHSASPRATVALLVAARAAAQRQAPRRCGAATKRLDGGASSRGRASGRVWRKGTTGTTGSMAIPKGSQGLGMGERMGEKGVNV